jgi:protein-L-isoaspartate O-methyltransferase
MLTKIKLFPIGAGTNYIAAHTVVSIRATNQERSQVLEIGTGSGYQTAVLCMMGARCIVLKGKMSCSNKPLYCLN